MIQFSDMERAGLLPMFFSPLDDRPAYEQLLANYQFGADMEGFVLRGSRAAFELYYPGDRPMKEISRAKLRDETLVLFEAEWLAIIQPDLSFRVHRVD